MDVKQVARLANLPISSSEEQKFADQFTATLKVVELINKLDTSSVQPTSQVTGLTNVTRQDIVTPERVLTQSAVLGQARRSHNGFVVVPRTIIDE